MPASPITAATPVSALRGVGEARAAAFARLGVKTAGDLLRFFPTRYEERGRIKPIAETFEGELCALEVTVENVASPRYISGGRSMFRCEAADESSSMELVFFNMPFLAKSLSRGRRYRVYGRMRQGMYGREMVSPKLEPILRGEALPYFVPVYRSSPPLTSKSIAEAVAKVLELADAEPEIFPEALRAQYGLIPRGTAIKTLHRPADAQSLAAARHTLAAEEITVFRIAAAGMRFGRERERAVPLTLKNTGARRFFESLPFELTGAQKRAVKEIFSDLSGSTPMARLLQGDVGSGKTAVAAAAIFLCAKNGYQSCIMAPTEILARQHAKTLSAMLSPFGINVGLLVAGMKAAEKHAVRAGLADGSINVAVGTQALISEATVMNNCALVIADEQHRFGVRQRAALLEKSVCDGRRAHILVMSATPIPRSLSLIIFGDLDLSLLDERPPGRREVATRVITESELPSVYEFVRREAAAGGRAYFVCPAIEEGEDDSGKISAEGLYKELSESIFPDIPIGLLHGRMRNCDKEHVMNAFACGDIKILVSTTVVEVGVDVPEATVMVIMNAESFGLSQLHQLRGRVGRGSRGSVCCLVNGGGGDEAADRLKVLAETNDGFRVAEADLKKRGPGDFFGERQSGEFSLAFMGAGDAATIKETDGIVTTIIENKETGEYSAVFGAAQRFLENSGSTLTVN